jgi:HD-GYP domain-containing protein (c-di-GMP phosphodiesterase class II)
MLEGNNEISKDVALGVLMHHEREDGSGYPFGFNSERIHYYAKILAVVDTFDAMTSNRIYKKRQTPFDVLEMYESVNTLQSVMPV